MKYKLYTTSLKAWDAMLAAIDRAKKTIYIEMYIFSNDTTGSHDFIGKLKQKASEGVEIIIVADSYGSADLRKISESLRQTGIEVLFFSHWLRHIHRKILIIDEKDAFIGGVNIGKHYKDWNDLQIKVSGKFVRPLLKSFAYTYMMSDGKNARILNLRNKKFSLKLKNWFIDHWPTKNIHTLKNHYVEKITGAKEKIQIVTPYFTPPRWLISLLDNAIKRDIAVEIIIPQKSDLPIPNRLNYYFIQKLYPLGVRFYLTKKMNHSKLLLIDEKEGLLGSQNIDPFSFRINSEAGIFFTDRKLTKDIINTIKAWKENSVEFYPEKFKTKIIDYFIMGVMKIFHPIL